MTTPKPQARMNPMHQQILGALIKTKPTSWNHRKIDPATGELTQTVVTGTALANPLAANVSAATIERMAQRWNPAA